MPAPGTTPLVKRGRRARGTGSADGLDVVGLEKPNEGAPPPLPPKGQLSLFDWALTSRAAPTQTDPLKTSQHPEATEQTTARTSSLDRQPEGADRAESDASTEASVRAQSSRLNEPDSPAVHHRHACALDRLVDIFARSPEAAQIRNGARWADELLHRLADDVGVKPAELSASALEELLFEIFPAKVLCEPRDAVDIIATLRALLPIVDRELDVGCDRQCRTVLAPGVEIDLAEALSNDENFTVSKMLLMMGVREGYDVHSAEGLAELWAAFEKGGPLPPRHLAARAARPRTADEKRIARNKRKAAAKKRR